MIRLALSYLIAISKTWSISEALWVLRVYHCENEVICWQNFWVSVSDVEVSSAIRAASQVRVKFYGGPKGTQECRTSLSIFVVDQVLRCWQQKKIDWAWLLQFNSDTMTHIKDQLERVKPDIQQKKSFPLSLEDERVGHWEPSDGATIM